MAISANQRTVVSSSSSKSTGRAVTPQQSASVPSSKDTKVVTQKYYSVGGKTYISEGAAKAEAAKTGKEVGSFTKAYDVPTTARTGGTATGSGVDTSVPTAAEYYTREQGKELYKQITAQEQISGKGNFKVADIEGQRVVLPSSYTQQDINYLADIARRTTPQATIGALSELSQRQVLAQQRSATGDIIRESLRQSQERITQSRVLPEVKIEPKQTTGREIAEQYSISQKTPLSGTIEPERPKINIPTKEENIYKLKEDKPTTFEEAYALRRRQYFAPKILKSEKEGKTIQSLFLKAEQESGIYTTKFIKSAKESIIQIGKEIKERPYMFFAELPIAMGEGVIDLGASVGKAGTQFIKGKELTEAKKLIKPEFTGALAGQSLLFEFIGAGLKLSPLRETKIEIISKKPIVREEFAKTRTRETLPSEAVKEKVIITQQTPTVYVGKPELFGDVPQVLKIEVKKPVVEELGVVSGYFGKILGKYGGEEIIGGKSIRVGKTVITDIRTPSRTIYLETTNGKTIQRIITTEEGKSKIVSTQKYKAEEPKLETVFFKERKLSQIERQQAGLTKVSEGLKTQIISTGKEGRTFTTLGTKTTEKQIQTAIATKSPIEIQKSILLATGEKRAMKIAKEKPYIKIEGKAGEVKAQPIISEVVKTDIAVISKKEIPSPITSKAVARTELISEYKVETIPKTAERIKSIGQKTKEMLISKKGELITAKREIIIPRQEKIKVEAPKTQIGLDIGKIEGAMKLKETPQLRGLIKTENKISTDIETKISPELKPTVSPVLEPKLSPILQPRLTPMVSPTLQPKLSPVLEPKLSPKIITKTTQVQELKVAQLPVSTTTAKTIQPLRKIGIVTNEIPIIEIPKPKIIKTKKKKELIEFLKKKKKKEAYIAKLKRRGKFIGISPPTTKESALDIGARAVSQTLGATFKVERVEAEPVRIAPTGAFRAVKSQLREFKISKGRRVPLKDEFIQKRSFRLSSRGEKTEIKQAKRLKWL